MNAKSTLLALSAALAANPLAAQSARPRWRPEAVPTNRSDAAMVLDEARGVILMFGGDDSGGVSNGRGDTWIWRDDRWLRLHPPQAPLPRLSHSIAYDPIQRMVLLHGGRDVTRSRNRTDTFGWDGLNWTLMNQGQNGGPGGRSDFAMAFDPGLGQVILFGGWSRNRNGVLGDTWAWDWGTSSWTLLAPARSPSPRMGHRMVLDEHTGRILLFGGRDAVGGNELDDTWTWHNGSWSRESPSQQPPAQSVHAMAYDSRRRATVLFGARSETWEWDGSAWQRAATGATSPPLEEGHVMASTPAGRGVLLFGGGSGSTGIKRGSWLFDGQSWREASASPPMRGVPAMAYDTSRERVVLFGGRQFAPFFQDTWEWDGERWHEVQPATMPPAEAYFNQMVYRSASGRCVLYAGALGTSELWAWDGSSWTRSAPAVAPPARRWTATAYDPQRDRIVLFGGQDAMGQSALGDTWEWDGTRWTQIPTPNAPSPRWFHSLAYDRARGKVLLFGGMSFAGPSRETWEWDGNNWTLRQPGTSPSLSVGAAMAYSASRERIVLFGGGLGAVAGISTDETWEWDGNQWSPQERIPTTGREFAGMAYDSARQRMVVFGGWTATPVSLTFDAPDVWTYFSDHHFFSPSPVALGGTLTLGLEIPSQPNAVYLLALSAGRFPGIPLHFDRHGDPIDLPLNADVLFGATFGRLTGRLDSGGGGSLPFLIPIDPALAARTYHSAAFTLQPSLNIGVITNETIITLN